MKLGFLASGRGSNMQSILNACQSGVLAATPVIVISNNKDSESLIRAKKAGIRAVHIGGADYQDEAKRDAAIVASLKENQVELVILAGYMRKIGPKTLKAYRHRILNIHPALLPRHGGKGMYGNAIHEAVLAAGEHETGVTIHLVDDEYDTGAILAQQRVDVKDGDTVDSLAERVLAVEHKLYAETLVRICDGSIVLPD